jgi:hypothetical protein
LLQLYSALLFLNDGALTLIMYHVVFVHSAAGPGAVSRAAQHERAAAAPFALPGQVKLTISHYARLSQGLEQPKI